MKIQQAATAFYSTGRSDQLDVRVKNTDVRQMRASPRGTDTSGVLSGMLIDRISFTRAGNEISQYNYSADVNARSFVVQADASGAAVHEQKAAMEKLVGGIIQKDVVIQKLQAQEPDGIGEIPGTGLQGTGRITGISVNRTQVHFEEETASFSSEGKVTTEDGREIEFSLDMSLHRAYLSQVEEETLITRWQETVNLTDPLVISLDGNPPVLSDAVFEFDLDNDGETEWINFTGAGSGFLAFDKNQDQTINDGGELFGPGTGNGFDELAAYDEDGNGWIDENDAVFSKLSVWTRDADGKDCLVTLKDAGIGAVSLGYAGTQFRMTDSQNHQQGQLTHSGVFLFEDGRAGSIHQVDLVSRESGEPVETGENALRRDSGVIELSRTIIPAAISRMVTPAPAPPQETEGVNPLRELLDRIEELKKKFEQLIKESQSITEKPAIRRMAFYPGLDGVLTDGQTILSGRSWFGKRV